MIRIFLSFFVLIHLISNGQFIKGEKFIGGTFNIDHQEDSNGSNPNFNRTDFSISPGMGFLVSKKLAVGGGVGLGSSSFKYNYVRVFIDPTGAFIYNGVTEETSSRFYSADLFGQRYFVISENFLLSITCDLSFMRSNSISTSYSPIGMAIKTPDNSYKLKASGGPSLIFLPSPDWGIYAGIGSIEYTYGYSISTQAYSNFFKANYGSFSLGFSYYFRKF